MGNKEPGKVLSFEEGVRKRNQKQPNKIKEFLKKAGGKARIALLLLALAGGGALGIREYLRADDEYQIMGALEDKINKLGAMDQWIGNMRMVKGDDGKFELYLGQDGGGQVLIASKQSDSPLKCHSLVGKEMAMDKAAMEECRTLVRLALKAGATNASKNRSK